MKVKKFMAVFLTFVMLAGMLPATAYAGECPAEDSSRNGGNHFWNVISATDPTCTSPGTVTSQCVYCDTTKTEQTGSALGHSWSDWAITKKATCTENGTRSHTCGDAGRQKQKTLLLPDTHGVAGHRPKRQPALRRGRRRAPAPCAV